MLAGHCLAARERRLNVVRAVHAGALPGQAWVVYEPPQGLVSAGFPWEDGHAPARSLRGLGLETVHANALWMPARHCCPWALLGERDSRGASCITRPPEGLPFEVVTTLRSVGRSDTGHVAAHRGQGREAHGSVPLLRRLRGPLDQATRDGERELDLRTHVPLRRASAKRIARGYRPRWTLATAFQQLAAYCHAEMNPLGEPKAALGGFCVALGASTMWAVVLAALRRVHGDTLDQELSLSDVAHESAHT